MKRTKALEATAHHEAGHAVAAFSQDVKINAISILPDGQSKGHIIHANPLRGIALDIDNSTRARLRIEKAVRVALAGPIAEREWGRRNGRCPHWKVGAEQDHGRAMDLISRIAGSREEANAYLRLLEIQTKQIVNSHWQRIGCIARLLLERGELRRKDIRQALFRIFRESVEPRSMPRTDPRLVRRATAR